jgi:hypothetical protein
MKSKWLVGALTGLRLAGVSVAANAVLLKSYDFDGDLTDTLGNGVDLIASGGSIAGGRYSFDDNEGLKLNSALRSTTEYGIEFKIHMDNPTGLSKLIDFQELASDGGLYEDDGAGLLFFGLLPDIGTVVTGDRGFDFTVGLGRSAGNIEVFFDGASLFVAADGGEEAVPVANILNFFEDDNLFGKGESFVGSVDFIRIHDDSSTFGTEPPTVPDPTTILLLGLGLAGLGFTRRRLH